MTSSDSETVRIFGIEYRHTVLSNGDDLYLTPYGQPLEDWLHPRNYWTDKEWFSEHSTGLFGRQWRYGGTGTLYRVHTRPVRGRSLDIVLKWNRMGQDIPGAHESETLLQAAFNSPYEEFALVSELRQSRFESPGRILTKRPLAIYVPARKMPLWQSARKQHKMRTIQRNHLDVDLDMRRNYAVIYEWIKGVDAIEAKDRGALTEWEMRALTMQADKELRAKGFLVKDHKPQHIIVRLRRDGRVLRDRHGRIPYALIDFELLVRTPEREDVVRKAKRKEYLKRQAHRFEDKMAIDLPPHLNRVSILGVDYIYGTAASTNGELWVVGKDPTLFDYFLPERWERSRRTKLSVLDEIYHTTTRDNVQLVWKLSRVGQDPYVDPFRQDEKRILEYGYNSPFEEFALSLYLSRQGIPTTYPRAIYMTGHSSIMSDSLSDSRHYESHKHLRTPSGERILRADRDYIAIWGYFNKPDEMLAVEDGDYYRSVDALQAHRQGILTEDLYLKLMKRTRRRLLAVGIEDLNLRGNHIMLSLDSAGFFVRDEDGFPETRICSYELLRRLDQATQANLMQTIEQEQP